MRDSPRIMKQAAYFVLSVVLCKGVWQLDTLTQSDLSIFYLLPIGIVSWFCDGIWAFAVAIISATAWLHADYVSGITYVQESSRYWNTLLHLGYFSIMIALSRMIVRLRQLSDNERKVSELKSDLISLVSHEFGNSLTTYILSLTILKESEPAETTAQRQTCYASLERVYTHLSGTIANFLNLNRIESGRFIPHVEEMSLLGVLHTAIAQQSLLMDKKKLAMHIDFPSHRVPVKADPDALSVVMSNLIGNAFKYTSVDGSVTVRVKVEDASGTVRVSVEDTGIGIPEADRLMIVSGFYRAEAGQKVAKGFGVGLKVTRELLESMGSKLEIESEPGRGSKFSFRLSLWTKGASNTDPKS